MRKRLRELRREFPFAEIRVTGSSHYAIVLPNGRMVTTSATPRCRDVMRRVRADVRRQLKKEGHQS
jgi:hypothetical protein